MLLVKVQARTYEFLGFLKQKPSEIAHAASAQAFVNLLIH